MEVSAGGREGGGFQGARFSRARERRELMVARTEGGRDTEYTWHRALEEVGPHQNSANPKEGVEQQVLSESRSSVHGGGRGGKAHLYLVSNYESTIISIFLLTVFT